MDVERNARSHPRASTVQEQRTLTGLYELHDTIGTGGFGKVKLATHIVTGETVAIKIMNKAALDKDYFRAVREIEILKILEHPRICQLYQVIDAPDKLYLVMEYCTNGELFDYVIGNPRLTEDKARRYFRQVISAVAYMHSKGIAHRDLKPENLMLDWEFNIKVIDFGLAAKPKGGMSALLETGCGSPQYVAPELISQQPYLGEKADVWSLGVLLYALLVGKLPFMEDDTDKLYALIQKGKFSLPGRLSQESQALVKHMLQVNPTDRIPLPQILKHPWVMQKYGVPVKWKFEDPCRSVVDLRFVDSLFPEDQYRRHHIRQSIVLKKYDYWYATYMLAKRRINQGKEVRLRFDKIPSAAKENDRYDYNLLALASPLTKKPMVRSPQKRLLSQISFDDPDSTSSEEEEALEPLAMDSFYESRQNDTYRLIAPKVSGPPSPAPRLTPAKSLENGLPDVVAGAFYKTKSVQQGLDGGFKTPFKPASKPISLTGKKGSAVRKMFGSIEKSIDRVVDILTPLKSQKKYTKSGRIVRVVRAGPDMTMVECEEPETLLNEIFDALQICNCRTKTKRDFLVRATKYNSAGEVILKFSLEVCILGDLGLGIRRKRLQGDTFAYRMLIANVMKILPSKNSFENPEYFLPKLEGETRRKLSFEV